MAKRSDPAPTPSPPPTTFAARLRALRAEAGWTQEELATRAGLSRPAIIYLECGERSPSWDTVTRLAEALNVSTEEFRRELERPAGQ